MEAEKFQDMMLEHMDENKKFQDMMLEHVKENKKFQDMTLEHIKGAEKFQDMTMEHMARLTQEITEVKAGQRVLTTKTDSIENRLNKLETTIENDVAKKFEVLFDGQRQMREQLNRIEEKVDRHDEIIIKRIK